MVKVQTVLILWDDYWLVKKIDYIYILLSFSWIHCVCVCLSVQRRAENAGEALQNREEQGEQKDISEVRWENALCAFQ